MLLPKQIWKDIAGYEGLYQVSNTGKVRSLDRVITYKNGRQVFYKSKILKQYLGKDGYMYVHLYKDKKNKRCVVHRLVVQAFLENPNNWPQVNHKDENKTNNAVCNLEWCTAKYNSNYGTRRERLSQSFKK